MAARTPSKVLRAVLSLFLVYHLSCILLVPNSDNPTGLRFHAWMAPYVYSLELSNTWSFFSPNTEPPIYIEYELVNAQGEAYERGRWPEEKDPFFLRERQNRRVTAADFMIANEVRAERMMLNHLCHQTPRPDSLRLWRLMESTPTPREVVEGTRKIGDGKGSDRKYVSHTFCPQSAGDGAGT